MLGQTEIVLLVLVVLVVAVFFIWRSRQHVRTAKKTGKIRGDYAVEDVLMKSGEKEAPAKTEPTLAPEAEAKPAAVAAADAAPSDIPPVYDVIEEEEERKRAAEEAARANAEEVDAVPAAVGSEWPAVDTALEWVLDISAPEKTTFKMGGLDSLRRELRALNLKLPLFVWTRSAEDGLYYESDRLQKSADHIVVAVVLANRAAQLDELTASSVLQVLETVATQYDINVRLSQEIPEAVAAAKTLRQFIRYYDNRLELEVVPLDPSVDFTLDAVAKLAAAFAERGKIVAAICAAPLILNAAGLLAGRRVAAHVCAWDEIPAARNGARVETDGNIITSRGAGTAFDFALALVEALAGKSAAAAVSADTMN